MIIIIIGIDPIGQSIGSMRSMEEIDTEIRGTHPWERGFHARGVITPVIPSSPMEASMIKQEEE